MGFSFVTPFLPLYIEQLGVHGEVQVTLWAALLSGGSAVFMAFAAPIWGALADRHGRKIMVVRAALSAGLIIGLMGLAQNVYQLLALRMVQGVFTGTVSASQALVSSESPKERLGFSLGLMQTAVFVGASIGPLAGGVVADAVGFRRSFAVAGVILFLAGVLVLGLVKETARPAGKEGKAQAPFWTGMWEALGNGGLMAMVGAVFAVQFATTVLQPILPQFIQVLQGAAGHVAGATGLVLAAAGVAGALSSVSTGLVADRVGYKRTLVVASSVAAVLSVPQYLVTATWQLLVLRVLVGLAMGAVLAASSALVAGLVPSDQRGTAYGLTGSANSIGFAAGPLTAAAVVDVSGLRPVFLTAAALLAFIALWVGVAVHVPREKAPVPVLGSAALEPTARRDTLEQAESPDHSLSRSAE
jgi:DHA1 family multidrug resistance protein-like MFS transporter